MQKYFYSPMFENSNIISNFHIIIYFRCFLAKLIRIRLYVKIKEKKNPKLSKKNFFYLFYVTKKIDS